MASTGLLVDGGSRRSGAVSGMDNHYIYSVTEADTRRNQFRLVPVLGPEFLYHRCVPGLVHITGKNETEDEVAGTGIVVHSSYVLTCRHVVCDMEVNKQQKFQGQEVNAQSIHPHPKFDVAVIRVNGPPLSPLQGMFFQAPVVAQTVYTLGYPKMPNLKEATVTIQPGAVTAESVTSLSGDSLFLYSAISRPGNSGGPVMSGEGYIVGLSAVLTTAGLAVAGALVLSVNHPNSTRGDFDLPEGLKHWTRTEDLRAALDWFAARSYLAAHADFSRIYAVGFSAGGWTALSLGGLRADLEGYGAHCETAPPSPWQCADLARRGVDLNAYSATEWNADRKDDRVHAVAAIDPALTYGLGKAHARDLVDKVLLIGFGDGETRRPISARREAGSPPICPMPRSRPWSRPPISRRSCPASHEARLSCPQRATIPSATTRRTRSGRRCISGSSHALRRSSACRRTAPELSPRTARLDTGSPGTRRAPTGVRRS